jgi:hypothetical protein
MLPLRRARAAAWLPLALLLAGAPTQAQAPRVTTP